MERLEKIPVPVIATMLSFLTLGNVYGGLGFVWLRWLFMAIGTVFIICYILKIALYPGTCIKEYDQTIPASLYGAFCMVLMVLGSFYYEMGFGFGRIIWFIAVAIHCIHIIVFTIKHTFGKVISKKDFINMMPSWFVTYNGWMVACVTGGKMNAAPILKVITIYGCIIYLVLLPFMLWRLTNVEIKNAAYHTMAVLLAPCSLCVVSLINVYGTPNKALLMLMYFCVLASLLFIIIKLPDFFSFQFYPGFAGMTFPMAIGVVASQKMAGYLNDVAGNAVLGNAVTQLVGLQIFLTTMLVGYVMLMFCRMLLKKQPRG
ncbi:MAG: TDT family transporter [Lachnospiraceae bacterium]|nr:TDT family transporter [Lachnospiraceae bacterium]